MDLTNSAVSVPSSLCCGWCQAAESAEHSAPTFPGMVNGCVARPPNFRRGEATTPPSTETRSSEAPPHAWRTARNWGWPCPGRRGSLEKKCCREAGAVAVYCGGRRVPCSSPSCTCCRRPPLLPLQVRRGRASWGTSRGHGAQPPLTTCACDWYRSESLSNDTGTRVPQEFQPQQCSVPGATGCSKAWRDAARVHRLVSRVPVQSYPAQRHGLRRGHQGLWGPSSLYTTWPPQLPPATAHPVQHMHGRPQMLPPRAGPTDRVWAVPGNGKSLSCPWHCYCYSQLLNDRCQNQEAGWCGPSQWATQLPEWA